jgi:acyl-CoA reductase-like NAD-dependent aldehyde dehydrogenase
LVLGGNRLTAGDLSKGYFIEPTIYDGVTSDMKISQEEIFGPVLSILTFDDEAEAIRIANNTIYDLSSSVWTKDVGRAIRAARSIEAGEMWINARTQRTREHPFGGYKQSGLGRELGGPVGLDEYLETKHLSFDLST